MIKFSIIVPVYNIEKYLRRCLDGLKNQTYGNIEVILIYGNSIDASTSICKEYCDVDARFVMKEQYDKGLPNARNIGLKIATGDYVLFVDSDDYILIDSCERFAKIADAYAPDIIVGEARVTENRRQYEFKHSNLKENKRYTGDEYSILAISERCWYAPVWLNAYRRKFILDNELMFCPNIYHEDLEYEPRTFFISDNVYYMQGYFYEYQIRADSLSQERLYLDKEIKDTLYVLNQWMDILQNMPDSELKKLFGGMLIKQFLYFNRLYNMSNRYSIKGMNYTFVCKYSLNIKELIKGTFFWLFPNVYRRL